MELRAYVDPLKRWWWLILVATLLAAASSYAFAREQPPIYQARVKLQVGNVTATLNPNPQELALTQQLAGTYAGMVNLESVRRPVMDALELKRLPEYRSNVIANTPLFEIQVLDTSPERAQAVANELARQIMRQSPGGEKSGLDPQDFVRQQLTQLENGILTTQQEIESRQQELVNAFSASHIAKLQSDITALETKLVTLQANHAAYLSNTNRGAVNTVQILEPAVLPVRPANSGRVMMILLMAIAIGFVMSASAAFVLDYLDNSFRYPDDVEKTLGVPILGVAPGQRTRSARHGSLTAAQEHPAVTESFRELRTNLEVLRVTRPLGRLLVTSAAPAEGKTSAAFMLARAFAEAGKKTVLLDADLYRPQLHVICDLPDERGLTNLLQEAELSWSAVLHGTAVANLSVIPAGPLFSHSAELLGSAPMRTLLDELQSRFDLVVLDSPPVNAVTDSLVLATQVDGVLMVVQAEQTRREVAERAVERLQKVRAPLVGVLLNRVPLRTIDYYRYNYTRPSAPVMALGSAAPIR